MLQEIHTKDEAEIALVDLRTRKKIFHVVLITHIVIIIIILVWGLAVEFFKPEHPKTMNVSLYTPPKTSGAPPAYTPPKTKSSKKKAVKKKPKKKKWKLAKKIKVSKQLVYIKPKKTQAQPKPMNKQKYAKTSSNTLAAKNYENSVGAYLYQLWDTPDKSLLGGKRPEVKIQLSIAANGQLLDAKILKSSGIAAMDKSIRKLLKKVKYLPVPSGGAKKITLILEVIE